MKQYAVIHGVCGLYEGYSDTTCEFFPKRGFADKHIAQILDDYRKDEMCVNIDHATEDAVYVTMDRDPDNYKACVPSDMDHDEYVAEHMDDVSVEVFQVIELDVSRYEGSGTTEHMWLTWDQQDSCVAWDYNPLCMSLVARVASDVQETNSGPFQDRDHHMDQLSDFISSVYYRNEAFIDIDDYTMHAFRIPKKLKTNA